MPLKAQFKIIMSSLVILLFIPILLYFLVDTAILQFLIEFTGYFAAVISILGIYLLMMNYIKHKEILKHENNKQKVRGYFQIEKINTSPTFPNLTSHKTSKLLVTDNFKRYETEKVMSFYQINLITEAKLILNLEINIEYKDLKYVDKLYLARMEEAAELFIPQRLSQTIENTLERVELKSIELRYETLAGEKMKLSYEEDYQKISCFGEDQTGTEIKLYTEYLSGVELRTLR